MGNKVGWVLSSILLMLVLTPSLVSAAFVTYNYSDTTNNKAYGTVQSANPPATFAAGFAGAEVNAGNYTALNSDNSVYANASGAVAIKGTNNSAGYSLLYSGYAGSSYPYNSINSLGKFNCTGSCADYAPLTNQFYTCVYAGGNWRITDDCTITTSVNLNQNPLFLDCNNNFTLGPGARIYNFSKLWNNNSNCKVWAKGGQIG